MEGLIVVVVLIAIWAIYYIKISSKVSVKNELDKVIPINKGYVSIKGSSQREFDISVKDENGNFKYKVKDGKRIKSKEISAENFILNKYPTIGWVAQGFIYSSILLILAHLDRNLYKTKIHQIFS